MTERSAEAEALSRFRIDNQGQYGGGSELEHDFGECDWDECIDGMNPLEVLALAREHAATCDGSRVVPAPAPAMSPMGEAIAGVWGNVLENALRRPTLSVPGTGALGA